MKNINCKSLNNFKINIYLKENKYMPNFHANSVIKRNLMKDCRSNRKFSSVKNLLNCQSFPLPLL